MRERKRGGRCGTTGDVVSEDGPPCCCMGMGEAWFVVRVCSAQVLVMESRKEIRLDRQAIKIADRQCAVQRGVAQALADETQVEWGDEEQRDGEGVGADRPRRAAIQTTNANREARDDQATSLGNKLSKIEKLCSR